MPLLQIACCSYDAFMLCRVITMKRHVSWRQRISMQDFVATTQSRPANLPVLPAFASNAAFRSRSRSRSCGRSQIVRHGFLIEKQVSIDLRPSLLGWVPVLDRHGFLLAKIILFITFICPRFGNALVLQRRLLEKSRSLPRHRGA